MRKIESTFLISSLLALAACGVAESDGMMPPGAAAGAGDVNPLLAGGAAVPGGAGASSTAGTTGNAAGTAAAAGAGNGAAGAAVTPDDMNADVVDDILDMTDDDVVPDEIDIPDAEVCVPGIPGTSQIPRLSAFEYENILSDLFGISNGALTLATDQAGVITQPTWEAYVSTANRAAVSVMGDATAKAKLMACDAGASEDECLTGILTTIGRKLFRRPLTSEEVEGFTTKIIAQRDLVTATGSLDETAELILSTLLQSPSFLQRAEIAGTANADGTFTLSQHEVAARLSFMLWGSIPDDALDAAADAGQLATKEQVLAQAQRMLQHENARRVVSTFHQGYMKLTSSGRWTSTSKDTTLYPNFQPDAVGNMIYEELSLFDAVFTSGGTFQDLLLTNKAWVTSYTAPLYGLTGNFSPTEYTEVELDGSRPGFLTRVGFLAAFANPERTNPIVRGTYIMKDVLGIDPGAPDPAAAQTKLPADPGLVTIREKVDDMTKSPQCAGCHHTYINPAGFALEEFDAAGQVQVTEVGSGGAIVSSADVKLTYEGDPVPVTGAADLMAKIAAAPAAQMHYAKKWVGYAYQRPLTEPDVCTAEAISQNLAGGTYAIRDLIADLTQQDYFTTRAIEVTQ